MDSRFQQLLDFPHVTAAKLRYSDTDRQGHVNNAIFVTLLEIARVEILYDPQDAILPTGCEFVVVRLELDLKSELAWPGEVMIGTGISKIGTSSIGLSQGLFQDGRCAALAQTVSVLVNDSTRKSSPLPPSSRRMLTRLSI